MEHKMSWEKLLSNTTQVPRESEPNEFAKYPMSGLEKDYKAIISSAAFRRLQDTTRFLQEYFKPQMDRMTRS